MSSRMMTIVPLLESSLLHNNRKEMLCKKKKDSAFPKQLIHIFNSNFFFLIWREFFSFAIVAKNG